MDLKQKIFDFLKNENPQLCVLSTVSDNKPESAVLAYVVLEDLSFIISTHSHTRKWKNVAHNKNVAVNVGWSFAKPNIQYEGTASPIENGEDYAKIEAIYFQAHPELKKFQRETTVFIKISPVWIRYTDLSTTPSTTEEMNLQSHV